MKTELISSVRRFHERFVLTNSNQAETLWLCMLTEEIGELTRSVLRDDPAEKIEGECGDIIYVLQGFCELFGYDLWGGIERTIQKNDLKTPRASSEARSGKIVNNSFQVE